MRGLNVEEIERVNGGSGEADDNPHWPDGSEVERQMQELKDFLEEQRRRDGRRQA